MVPTCGVVLVVFFKVSQCRKYTQTNIRIHYYNKKEQYMKKKNNAYFTFLHILRVHNRGWGYTIPPWHSVIETVAYLIKYARLRKDIRRVYSDGFTYD